MAGRACKMAITRASRVKTRSFSAHRIRNFMLFSLVLTQIGPEMHVAPGNRDLLPFWAVSGLKTLPALAGRASKMAITRASRVKTRSTSAHCVRNPMLFDLVRAQILPKMHVTPGNGDLLPFWAVFGLITPPVGCRLGV